MNDNEFIVKTSYELLKKQSPVVLASIVSLQGSSPRHIGTKMLFAGNGKSYGTIGGSLLEATVIKESWSVLASGRSRFMRFELMGMDAFDSGMICGGKTEILLAYRQATQENLEFLKSWLDMIQQDSNFYIMTRLKDKGDSVDILGHSLVTSDGKVVIGNFLKPSDLGEIRAEFHNISVTSVVKLQDTQVVVDPIRKLKTVFCFGAGHVALPTAHIAALVGFRVVVIDDRAEYASDERFPEASRIHVISDFNQALNGLEIGSDSFIIIITRGHQFDREVLAQALKTPAGYIGMISSRKKRDSIYQALQEEGFTSQDLLRVHSPIGVKIGGETPEEIAVSIVAELIQFRSGQYEK
jgi:xanthine dehydrogenase accessory factor